MLYTISGEGYRLSLSVQPPMQTGMPILRSMKAGHTALKQTPLAIASLAVRALSSSSPKKACNSEP